MTTGQLPDQRWAVQCDVPGCANEIDGADLTEALSNASLLGWLVDNRKRKEHVCSDCVRGTSAPALQVQAAMQAAAAQQASVQAQSPGAVPAQVGDMASIHYDDLDVGFEDDEERARRDAKDRRRVPPVPFDKRSGATLPGITEAPKRPPAPPAPRPVMDERTREEIERAFDLTIWNPDDRGQA